MNAYMYCEYTIDVFFLPSLRSLKCVMKLAMSACPIPVKMAASVLMGLTTSSVAAYQLL